MSDQETIPESPEVSPEAEAEETPTQEVEATEEEERAEDATTEEEDDESESKDGEDEDAEIELKVGGQTLRVPKGAIPEDVASQIQQFVNAGEASLTRKFQEVAEQRKGIEAAEKAVQKLRTMNGEVLETFTKGQQVRAELGQLLTINLNELWQSNPDDARRVSDRIAQKQAEFNSIVNNLSQQEAQLTQAEQGEVTRRMEEGRTAVEKYAKGFTARANEVVDYAMKHFGFSKEEAEEWPLHPKTAAMAYKAMLYDRMQAQAGTKKPAAKTPQPAQPVKPMPSKGQAKAAKDPDKMSMDEWMAWRQGQLAKGS